MSNHKAFIFTPITTVLKEAVAASYVIGNGIETYALSEYIMNSLFLKMTGFQEQKMKCIAWEMATYDYGYRRSLLQNEDKLGEYSSYKAKSAIYKRLTGLIMSLNKKFDISDIDKQKLIDDSLEDIKSIFSNSGLATWTQKKFNYFVGNVITNTEQFLMNNDKLFEDLPKEPQKLDESKYDLTNEKGEKAYKKQLEKYENKLLSFYINTELNLKIKYEELYDNRNKLAHNTLSYQDNLPSLKALQNESDNSRNFFVWFFILVLIDKIFMDLFQKYMAELEENIF